MPLSLVKTRPSFSVLPLNMKIRELQGCRKCCPLATCGRKPKTPSVSERGAGKKKERKKKGKKKERKEKRKRKKRKKKKKEKEKERNKKQGRSRKGRKDK